MEPPTNNEVQVTLVDQPDTQLKVENELTTKQPEKFQSPPIIEDTQKDSTEKVVTQLPIQTTQQNTKRAIIKSVPLEPAKQKLLEDDDDDDSLSIFRPIDMNTLSASEMMKIVNVMQS